MTRVLVTGGSGQLGSYVVDELQNDFEVTVFDLEEPSQDVRFRRGNVLDQTALANAIRDNDAIVHLAALDDFVDASDSEFMSVNAMGTWNVFEVAKSLGIDRIVHCSSVAAVNISPENPPRSLPVDSSHACQPATAYGLSKLLGEQIAQRFAFLTSISVVCLRPTLVMQHPIAYSIAKSTASADGTPLPPIAAHHSWEQFDEVIPGSRSCVDPRDAARAFRAGLEVNDMSWGVFYVGARDTYSALPTLDIVRREFGVAPDLQDTQLYDRNPRASIYDIATTSRDLHWEPRVSWEDLLSEVMSAATSK